MTTPRVCYIHSESLIQAADALPSNLKRASLVHDLITSLGLLETDEEDAEGQVQGPHHVLPNKAYVVNPTPATKTQLERFHDPKFINALLSIQSDSDSGSDSEASSSRSVSPPRTYNLVSRDSASPRKKQKMRESDSYGLEDDCPLFDELPDYVTEVAGASIQAARELRDGRADVAVSWTGGRHHANRGSASGFCYVNDIVLAILELRLSPPRSVQPRPPKLDKILYLDLDLHHGDGVESAFLSSSKVLTLSLHLQGPCFFPATGKLTSTGPSTSSPSAYHALNIALEPGLSSSNLRRVMYSCVQGVYDRYGPDAVVVQCGVDGLNSDPCKEWNLGIEGMGEALRMILGWEKKTLLLGGGGYNSPNAARCWAYFTSIALGQPLSLETPVPPSVEHFTDYAPAFTLDAPAGDQSDRNTDSTLSVVEEAFETYIAKLGETYQA